MYHRKIDQRTHEIEAHPEASGPPDDCLEQSELANWLGTSGPWLAIGRSKGYGPPFIRLGPGIIRYRRCDVLAWLEERRYRSTAEYADDLPPRSPGRPRSNVVRKAV